MNDLAKLPKWARERIEIAERDLGYLREEQRKRGTNERTRVAIQDLSQLPQVVIEQFVPEHSPIRFYFEPNEWIEAHILKRNSRLVLEIRAGNYTLRINPVANNVIHLTPDKD